jgi:hypothetical protein
MLHWLYWLYWLFFHFNGAAAAGIGGKLLLRGKASDRAMPHVKGATGAKDEEKPLLHAVKKRAQAKRNP